MACYIMSNKVATVTNDNGADNPNALKNRVKITILLIVAQEWA